jgi:DNA polymerase-3 subunit gamma/tau
MTFYLKYRPQTLQDLDLISVRESLKKIVASGNIPHAFLFAGPRGTGKTSAARILAKAVNCQKPGVDGEPCNKCDQCISITKGDNLDILELDAASHRGIEDIRALRDSVKLAPARAKKKVYIIDEAHMLTSEASNALLKTLEEPPTHVMFILATTNPEKLIETVRSRTTKIAFNKAILDEIVGMLKKVVKGEKLKADDGAMHVIAQASDGSFRDAVKILEQLVGEKVKLEQRSVSDFLLSSRDFDVTELLTLLAKHDAQAAISFVDRCIESGTQAKMILDETVKKLRSILLTKVGLADDSFDGLTKADCVLLIKFFMRASREQRYAVLDQLPMEIAIIDWCGEENSNGEVEDDSKDTSISKKKDNGKIANGKKTINAGKDLETIGATVAAINVNGNIGDDVWGKILSVTRAENTSIEALLRAARPLGFDGKTLKLGVFYRFHKERLEENSHRKILEDIVGKVVGGQVRISCILTEQPKREITQVEESGGVVLAETKSGSSVSGNAVQSSETLTEGDDMDIINLAKDIFSN